MPQCISNKGGFSRFAFGAVAAAVFSLLASDASAQGGDIPSPEEVPGGELRHYPYRLVGRLAMFSGPVEYIGSGTVAARKGVLTCAHNMFEKDQGFSFEIIFQRGLNGLRSLQSVKPTRIFVYSGYVAVAKKDGAATEQAFARDLAGLRFKTLLAGGVHLKPQPQLDLLKQDGVFRRSLGYGGREHDGQTLLEASGDEAWTVFRTGYFRNGSYLLEPGMSGGPTLIEGSRGAVIVAVNVSGSSILSGFRVINTQAMRFIRNSL